jgi:Mak10 subunit, NatC N(alpha)-terminal acetyltransferase
MNEFEAADTRTPEDELEDVTDIIFKALDELKDCEFLAKPDFDLLETMSAFESMDPKMDMRLRRNEVPHPVKLIKAGDLIVDRPLTSDELIALFDQFFIQVATWQDQTAQLQQTVYSC